MKNSETFERQVHRIYELLEGSGAEVTWNDHVPDPDNPSQQRQIDVTIKRNGKLTIVECCDRQSPQDVTWIEELIGRRISLKVDTTIAVSSSGFTAGAPHRESAAILTSPCATLRAVERVIARSQRAGREVGTNATPTTAVRIASARQ